MVFSSVRPDPPRDRGDGPRQRRHPARLRPLPVRRRVAGRGRQAGAVARPSVRDRRQRQLPRLGRRHGRRLGPPPRDLRVLPRPAHGRLGGRLAARPVPVPRGLGRGGARRASRPCAASTARCIRLDHDALRGRPGAPRTPCCAQRIVKKALYSAMAELDEDHSDHHGPSTATPTCPSTTGRPRRTPRAVARLPRPARRGPARPSWPRSPPAYAATSSPPSSGAGIGPHRRRPLGHRHPRGRLLVRARRSTRPARTDPSRDRFVLSKGHCAAALYSTLASCGFFPRARAGHLRPAALAAQRPPQPGQGPGRGDQHRPARPRLPGRHRLRAGRQGDRGRTTARSS